MASVTTIDEINMGFELAILAGQEAMLEESSEEGKTSPWQARDQCKTRTCLVTGDGGRLSVCQCVLRPNILCTVSYVGLY